MILSFFLLSNESSIKIILVVNHPMFWLEDSGKVTKHRLVCDQLFDGYIEPLLKDPPRKGQFITSLQLTF